MTEVNGQFGGKKVQEILLDSGEYIYVQPLSIYAVRALQDKAEELFPSPDKTEYEKPVDDAKALEPGLVIPAEENADYRAAFEAVEDKRSQYMNDKAVLLCVQPMVEQAELIAKYKHRLKQLRAIMTLPEDAWEATLKFVVISSTDDYNRVLTGVRGVNTIPTEDEIRDGMRIFRPYVRQARPARDNRKQESPRPQEDDANSPQRAGRDIQSGGAVGVSHAKPDVA